MLDKSIKALEERGEKIVNHELAICDKLNQNDAFSDFNPSSLNPVLANAQFPEKTINKSSRASLGNGDSPQIPKYYYQVGNLSIK